MNTAKILDLLNADKKISSAAPANLPLNKEENVESKSLDSHKSAKLKELDETYEKVSNAKAVENAIRVEQGEYAVLRRNTCSLPIGTHHVTPCIVICAKNNLFYGMAHFDSYRLPQSLEQFFNHFETTQPVEVQILGGKDGQDPLRTGSENREAVTNYIHEHVPHAKVLPIEPQQTGPIDCVFYSEEGIAKTNQFARGLNLDKEEGINMRLIHNIGAIITAIQSRTEQFLPINLVKAYDGSQKTFLLDRLALNALEKYDAGTNEEIEKGWSSDSSGTLLAQEVKLAADFIREEVCKQQKIMENKLSEQIPQESAAQIISICPVFLGQDAEKINAKIIDELIKLHENNKQSILPEALSLFNHVSDYPLMEEIIPLIAENYEISNVRLREQLGHKFGDNLNNLAYGVDVFPKDVIPILIILLQEENPGFYPVETLKLTTPDAEQSVQDLAKQLCAVYKVDFQATLDEICNKYKFEINEKENKAQIIRILDEKSESSKNDIIQVIEEMSSRSKVYIRKLDEYWKQSPHTAAESIFRLMFSNEREKREECMQKYTDKAAVRHQAFLNPSNTNIKQLSFNENSPGIHGILGKILNNCVIKALQNNPSFKAQSEKKRIDSINLTKAIRDKIPYKSQDFESRLGENLIPQLN